MLFFKKYIKIESFRYVLYKFIFKVNRFIPFKNYSIIYFIDGKYHLPFATNIHQILLGLLFAKKNSFNFYFKGSKQINEINLINVKSHNLFRYLKKKYRFYYFDRSETDFFERKNFFDNKENDFPIFEGDVDYYYKNIHSVARNDLFQKIRFYKNIEISDESLVIHLRAGDIFYNDWHSLYVQNPINFYTKISKNYKDVLVVTEHEKNNFLLNELKKRIELSVHSGSLEEDANILLNARNLATSGVSAFPIACALMSQKLNNLIVSDLYLEEHLNPKMMDKKIVNVELYKINNYIKIGEFKKNKKNLEKILSHKESEIFKIK